MDELSKRIASLSPAKRALLERRLQKSQAEATSATISRRTDVGPPPLSFAQQRLWILDRWQPGSAAYNMSMALQVDGQLDVPALERSLTEIVRRHEAVRTTFSSKGEVPVQIVQPPQPFPLRQVDLTATPADRRDADVHRLANEETVRAFDLGTGPLLRGTLLKLEPQKHALFITMHHIVSDGWSMSVLYRELSALYEAFSKHQPSPLPELPIQYPDYAAWQRRWLQGEVLANQLSYWREQLGDLPTLELPIDRPRPPVQTFQGGRVPFRLPRELTEALQTLSRREGTTMFITLLTAFQGLLARYTGQEDIVVGTPIANRTRMEMEGLIGFFVNMLVLRTNASGDPTFRELLARAHTMALSAYANQDIPFEKLVEELHPRRDPSRNPLFQVVFALQNAPRSTLTMSGLTLSRMDREQSRIRFDIEVHVQETTDGLDGFFLFNIDLFESPTIARMAGHFQTMLEGIVANPNQRVSQLPMLTSKERHQLLVEWNDTLTDYPREKTIHELFEAQAAQTPEAVAVVFGDSRFTYRGLNARANQLAHYLRKNGVGPDVLVGICVERSIEMLVGILGILKSGGAYVPLDPSYPKDRLAFILKDTATPLLLTQRRLFPCLPETTAKIVCLDDESIARLNQESLPNNANADHLAYVMYTSGSTGTPKGVCVTHRGVVRLVRQTNFVTISADDVFLQFAPASFDASTFEIWGSLLNGSKLVVFPPHIPSLDELGQAIEHNHVTILWLTASLFQQMVDGPVQKLGGIRQLLAGGDVLSASHARKLLQTHPHCTLINGYGPTESTTFACCYPMNSTENMGDSLPIGRPISNTQVFILDPHMQLVPAGVWGELHIGGDGLARGYLNRPELTAEKFVPNPFSNDSNSWLYKTGDMVRYRADGNIEFRGRIDHQVKIRGFRIELGEIEAVFRQQQGVADAVVIARQHGTGDKRLVAYLVPARGETVSTDNLRQILRAKLPEYMVPSAVVVLDSFPLSANGKVNRNALPEPERERSGSTTSFAMPRTSVEERITQVWTELLGVNRVGIHDNFFDLGGHSLLAIQLVSRLQNAFHVEMPVRALFDAPTVAGLAERIKSAQIGKHAPMQTTWSFLVPIQEGTTPPIFLLPGGGGGEEEFLVYARLARHLGEEYTLYGLQARGADGVGKPHARVEQMAADYLKEIRSLQPHGPYHIIGECVGGIVAYEMARQIHAQGDKVDTLILMDTRRPTLLRYVSTSRIMAGRRFRESFRAHILDRIAHHRQILGTLSGGERMAYFVDKLAKSVRLMLHLLRVRQMPVTDARREQVVQVKRARAGYSQRLLSYRPKPYGGCLTLIVNREEFRSDQTLGWDGLAAGGIESHQVPGNHLSYIREHVESSAAQLRVCLEKTTKGQ